MAKRSLPDSNWSKRFCRPAPSHSVKRPYFESAKLQLFFIIPNFIRFLFTFLQNYYIKTIPNQYFLKIRYKKLKTNFKKISYRIFEKKLRVI
jgi:hypothetical protein